MQISEKINMDVSQRDFDSNPPSQGPQESTKECAMKIFKKAAEIEDIDYRKPKTLSQNPRHNVAGLRREAESLMQNRDALEEEGNLEIRNGHMWKCIGRIPEITGGSIYHYQLEKKYCFSFSNEVGAKNLNDVNSQIGPAIEPSWRSVEYELKKNPLFLELGFEIIRDYLVGSKEPPIFSAPNNEALINRLEKLREKHPQLPNLHIVSSKGIASDYDYALATVLHDLLVCVGQETIHDLYAHGFPTLKEMLSSLTNPEIVFKNNRYSNTRLVLDFYRRIAIVERVIKDESLLKSLRINKKDLNLIIQHFDKMVMLFGYLADLISNNRNRFWRSLDDFENTSWRVWQGTEISSYVKKRFGTIDKIDSYKVQRVWRLFKQIERLFDCYLYVTDQVPPSTVRRTRADNIGDFLDVCSMFPEESPMEVAFSIYDAETTSKEIQELIKQKERVGSVRLTLATQQAKYKKKVSFFSV